MGLRGAREWGLHPGPARRHAGPLRASPHISAALSLTPGLPLAVCGLPCLSFCLLIFVYISVSQAASLWDPEIGCGALVPKKGLNPGCEEPQRTEA